MKCADDGLVLGDFLAVLRLLRVAMDKSLRRAGDAAVDRQRHALRIAGKDDAARLPREETRAEDVVVSVARGRQPIAGVLSDFVPGTVPAENGEIMSKRMKRRIKKT